MNSYSATVGYDTTELDIRAAANLVAKEGSVVYVSLGTGARTLLDSSESYKVYPDVGDQNYVAVSVEYTDEEDGVTVINTYTIQVTRSPQSSEDIAILSSINAYDINGTVNVGGVDFTGSAVTEPLSFDASVLAYTRSIQHGADAATVEWELYPGTYVRINDVVKTNDAGDAIHGTDTSYTVYDLVPGTPVTVSLTILPSSTKDTPDATCTGSLCTTYTVTLTRMNAGDMAQYYSLKPSTQRSTSVFKASSTDKVGYTIELDTEGFMANSNTGLKNIGTVSSTLKTHYFTSKVSQYSGSSVTWSPTIIGTDVPTVEINNVLVIGTDITASTADSASVAVYDDNAYFTVDRKIATRFKVEAYFMSLYDDENEETFALQYWPSVGKMLAYEGYFVQAGTGAPYDSTTVVQANLIPDYEEFTVIPGTMSVAHTIWEINYTSTSSTISSWSVSVDSIIVSSISSSSSSWWSNQESVSYTHLTLPTKA